MAHTIGQRPPRRSQPPASGRPAGLRLTAQDQEAICQALTDYHSLFADCFYRREQRHWSAVYLCGQLSNVERKTIEPMLLDLLGCDRNAVRAADGTLWFVTSRGISVADPRRLPAELLISFWRQAHAAGCAPGDELSAGLENDRPAK